MAHHHNHLSHAERLPQTYSRAYVLGIALNLGYVAVELIYGYWIDSVSLISDGMHNLSDVLGLVLSLVAFLLMTRQPRKRFTYGYGKTTILAAYLNGLLLLGMCIFIGIEAIHRFQNPTPVPSLTVALVSGIGVLVNTGTALLFLRSRKTELNARSAYLHMAADALVSAGVVVSALLMYYTGWYLLDPIMSIVILTVIGVGSVNLFKEATTQILDAAPLHIPIDEVEKSILATPSVAGLHDLHIWNITTEKVALTAHLLVEPDFDRTEGLDGLHALLTERFGISQTTLQLEDLAQPAEQCEL